MHLHQNQWVLSLGIVLLAIGIVIAGANLVDGNTLTAIYGGAMASSGLGLIISAHIGRALVAIAVSNDAILERLINIGK